MAEKALRKVCLVLEKPLSPSVSVPLPGTPHEPWEKFLKTKIPQWVNNYGLKENQVLHLARLYGQKAEVVLNHSKSKPGWMETLHPERPEILAQVAYAVQGEKALHLEDVLLRRLEIGYSPYRWGEAAEKSSHLMAQLLGWSEEKRLEELERYRQNLYPQPSA
jgi:glycerol-3-phosphate dehydrogenase